MNLADRLEIACNHAGTDQKKIADTLGISKNTVYAMKNGKMKFAPYADRIAKILAVPAQWLEHGTGPAPSWLAAPESILPAPPNQAQILAKILETQTHLLAAIEKMNQRYEQQAEILSELDQRYQQQETLITHLAASESPPQLPENQSQPTKKARTA